MASNLRVDSIVPSTSGNVSIGTATGGVIIPGDLGIAGVLTYEDVTNVDSVGVITARSTIDAQGDVSVADKIIHTGDTNTAIRFPSADTITTETGGTERLRITSDGELIVGMTAGGGATPDARLQVRGDNHTRSKIQVLATHNDDNPATLQISKSRGSGNTILGDNDDIGQINFAGNDGNGYHTVGRIMVSSSGDGNGNDDLPTMMRFFTTPNGGVSLTERMRISSDGYVTKPNQPTFHAYGNNSWTQYTGSNNIVKLLNSACNVGGHYKTSGSDEGKFVCPIAGNYFFYLTLYSGRTDNGQTDNNDYLSINFISSSGSLSNNGGHHIRHYYNEGDRDSTSTLSIIKTCTAGETMHIMISCNGTGYQIYGGHSGFGGYLIG